MKKIGIITMFYKSHNYGGLLQAYALPRFIRKMGFYSEQIQIDITKKMLPQKKIARKITIKKVFKYLYRKLIAFSKKCFDFYCRLFKQEAIEGIKKKKFVDGKVCGFCSTF